MKECEPIKHKTDGACAPLTIRRARREDYQAVYTLEKLEFDMHRQARPDYFKAQAESYSQEEFEQLLAQPCPIAWLAVCEEKIIGLCFGRIAASAENSFCRSRKVAFIEDLVTLPEWRGQGVATALLKRARGQALAEGAQALELCVWSFNRSAMRLYERLGMRVQYYRMEESLENG